MVPAVLEADGAVHDQAAPSLDQVKGKCQVLADVEAFAEVHGHERVRPPADGREVGPVGPHQADRERLTAQQPAPMDPRGIDPLHLVDQAHAWLVVLVDDLDSGLDDLR